jgi:hypothetical protein
VTKTNVVQRHLTVNGVDEQGNILPTIMLKPGDEVPEELRGMEQDHWFTPLPGDEPVVVDEETGTELREGAYIDHTSPTVRAGHEGGVVDRQEGSYESMNKDQLSALLEERQLPKSGTRQDLIERLQASDAENS